MADIRALMAQERQARRINHQFASYTKSGALMCTACNLNVRSEALWDGHLKSANHKANAKKTQPVPKAAVKRKIDDVEEDQPSEDSETRKKLKPKPRGSSEMAHRPAEESKMFGGEEKILSAPVEVTQSENTETVNASPTAVGVATSEPPQTSKAEIDEDEWDAFERDVAPLAQPDYSAATITAAPVSAAQLQAEAESDRKKLRDTEAEDEKEDEGRRMEEEFEVMEEMEERVRKLKEKREALRLMGQSDPDTGQSDTIQPPEEGSASQEKEEKELSDDSDEDVDDWYS